MSGQKGPIDFSAAISRWDYTGFSAVNYRRGASERDAFHNWQASTRVGIKLPYEGRLDLNFRFLQGKSGFDGDLDPGSTYSVPIQTVSSMSIVLPTNNLLRTGGTKS